MVWAYFNTNTILTSFLPLRSRLHSSLKENLLNFYFLFYVLLPRNFGVRKEEPWREDWQNVRGHFFWEEN